MTSDVSPDVNFLTGTKGKDCGLEPKDRKDGQPHRQSNLEELTSQLIGVREKEGRKKKIVGQKEAMYGTKLSCLRLRIQLWECCSHREFRASCRECTTLTAANHLPIGGAYGKSGLDDGSIGRVPLDRIRDSATVRDPSSAGILG